MNFSIVHSVNQFNAIYENNLKKSSCLPICLEDLCAGWTIDSFRQILSRVTLKSQACIPLIYNKYEDLSVFSNKIRSLQEVFKLFDTRGLSRIDGMELICVFIMISSGSLLKKLEASFYSFSLSEDGKINRDTFCFFLDSFCRGLSKAILTETDTFYPKNPNYRLSSKEIELVASVFFKNNEERLSHHDFYSYIQKENGPLKRLFSFPQDLQKAQEQYRDTTSNRLKVIPFIKTFIYELLSKIDYK